MHLWLRLGIVQVNLASALALHKRSFKLLISSADCFPFTCKMTAFISGLALFVLLL